MSDDTSNNIIEFTKTPEESKEDSLPDLPVIEDPIDSFLDLDAASQMIETVDEEIKVIERFKEEGDVDDDFQYARENLYSVIEKGSDALKELLDVATQRQAARDFEVISGLINTLSNANMVLMDLNKKKNDAKGVKPGGDRPTTVNNNLFVGSTGELQKKMNALLIAAEEELKNES